MNAQEKNNFELIGDLITQSIEKIELKSDEVNLNLIISEGFEPLQNRIYSAFKDKFSAVSVKKSDQSLINYSINSINVEYGETFKDGFFGDIFAERKIEISGNYSIIENSKLVETKDFLESIEDTVNFGNLKSIENYSLPFTQGEKPNEPFLSGLTEPAIAIGTAIVTVVLFFTVRSN